MSDESYTAGMTDAELLAYFTPEVRQSFRENDYWRQRGHTPLLYALDFIDALERQYQTLLKQVAAALTQPQEASDA